MSADSISDGFIRYLRIWQEFPASRINPAANRVHSGSALLIPPGVVYIRAIAVHWNVVFSLLIKATSIESMSTGHCDVERILREDNNDRYTKLS